MVKKNGVSAYRDFFSLLKKKKGIISTEFFFQAELFFFFYYLFVYSTAVVFLIRQVLCFCLTLVLAISVLTQEIYLLSISQSASWLLPYLETSIQGGRGRWGQEGGGGKHC